MSIESDRKKIQRHKAVVSVYWVHEQDDAILLSLRQNTGFEDGKYGLVSGHVEKDESATEALAREIKEEVGVDISPDDLVLAHVMHVRTDREDVALFYRAKKYTGTIQNTEPHKCQEVAFFNTKALPKNTIKYIQSALRSILSNQVYSEFGWCE